MIVLAGGHCAVNARVYLNGAVSAPAGFTNASIPISFLDRNNRRSGKLQGRTASTA
jgi:hypothetical protein